MTWAQGPSSSQRGVLQALMGDWEGGLPELTTVRAPYATCCNAASQCRRVIWQGDVGSRRGLYADFQNINMHAISSDQSAARKPCIYMQLEPSASAFADTAEGEADDDEDVTPEVRLVPEDASKCRFPILPSFAFV